MSATRWWTPILAVMLIGTAAAEPLRFNREVRPILSDKCFNCHGPDAATRKGRLRLDVADGMKAGIIEPGQPDASELIARITTHDPDDLMPPAESNLSLSAEEVEILTRWIAEGGEYEPHWAFIPVTDPKVPEGAEHPIDAYVQRRLEGEGLTPRAEADRETLIRRLSFDLRGLPPTLEEIDAFLADESPNAYEKLVDDFLADPAYGERMAMLWLDAARYADTFGYQSDVENDVWPWREWVIRAFNENKPYDVFITEQLAGDLLENPTQDQRLATTFNRLHRQTNEGGSIPEEFRTKYVFDRTETMGMAVMAMTLECARCHDHKFDPISQREYFELFSFFNNIDESGMYSHFTRTAPSPSMLLYKDGQAREHDKLRFRIESRERRLTHAQEEAREAFASWITSGEPEALPKPIHHWTFDTLEGGQTPDVADDKTRVKVALNPTLAPGVAGQALALTGDDGVTADRVGQFERHQPFSMAMWLRAEQHVPHAIVAHRCTAELDAASRGIELMLEDGRPTFSLVHFWPGNAIRVMTREPIPEQTWVHVAATYDGSSTAAGVKLYVNGYPAEIDVIRDHLFKTIRYEGGDPPFKIGHRFRDVGFKGGQVDDFRLYDESLTPLDVRAIATGLAVDELWPHANEDERFDLYLGRQFEPAREAREALQEAHAEEHRFVESMRHIMTMIEMDAPRQAHVLERGEYDQPADPVEPDTPESILAFSEDLPRNRLGLAQWLVDPRHPLTSRVAVNRYWQVFFGRGLVETQEDFGSQGAPPSHPDLLDHLAHVFMDSDWDIKALCRYIVTSETYRRDGNVTPELAERDPKNVLLARGPSHRLSAEQIRDQALAASGLLVDRIGGASVRPYQPDGLWKEAGSQTYAAGSGDALYRRSMYTFIKRTVPPPTMTTFDATNREVCVVQRERTTTPLQALVLLNDPQFVEAARVLAERTFEQVGGAEEKLVTQLFRKLTGTQPDEREREILMAALEEQREVFAADADAAAQYLETGEYPRESEGDAAALAAATALAQAIMNFDAFQVKP